MRVRDSQAYRKMDVTRERISRILELREKPLSIQFGFSLVNAAVACDILQSNSGLEPSSVVAVVTAEVVAAGAECAVTLCDSGAVSGLTAHTEERSTKQFQSAVQIKSKHTCTKCIN